MKRNILFIATFLAFSINAFAQFTPGNLVVLRVGVGGTTALNGNTTAVSLVEFTPAGVQVGSPLDLNSTTAGSRITINGTSNEGLLKLSGNGQFLTLAGYDIPVATAATTAVLAATQKVIVSVDNNKAVNYSTKIIANDVGGNLRTAVTNDNSGFWFGTSGSGVRYVPFGNGNTTSVNATQLTTTTPSTDVYTNIRSVGIFGGQVYASVTTGTNHGVSSIGSGLPTTLVEPNKSALPGVTVNTTMGDFVLLDMNPLVDGVDVLYVSELSTLKKYSLVSGTWTLNSTTSPGGGLAGIYGINAIKNTAGTAAAIFITTGNNASNTTLQYVLDTGGHNAALSGTFTDIATAGTNYAFRGIAFTPNTTTLPVDLTTFKGQNTTNGVQLNWETASEKNNDRFDILRSNDKDNFQVISSVKGKGNSNGLNTYSYLDAQPLPGTNYYKLNQVDFDGKTTPSEVIAVKTGLIENTVNFYVVSDDLNITINALKANTAVIGIYDISGRKVLSKTINLNAGFNTDKLNISDLQKGVYMARIQLDNQMISKKIVK